MSKRNHGRAGAVERRTGCTISEPAWYDAEQHSPALALVG